MNSNRQQPYIFLSFLWSSDSAPRHICKRMDWQGSNGPARILRNGLRFFFLKVPRGGLEFVKMLRAGPGLDRKFSARLEPCGLAVQSNSSIRAYSFISSICFNSHLRPLPSAEEEEEEGICPFDSLCRTQTNEQLHISLDCFFRSVNLSEFPHFSTKLTSKSASASTPSVVVVRRASGAAASSRCHCLHAGRLETDSCKKSLSSTGKISRKSAKQGINEKLIGTTGHEQRRKRMCSEEGEKMPNRISCDAAFRLERCKIVVQCFSSTETKEFLLFASFR